MGDPLSLSSVSTVMKGENSDLDSTTALNGENSENTVLNVPNVVPTDVQYSGEHAMRRFALEPSDLEPLEFTEGINLGGHKIRLYRGSLLHETAVKKHGSVEAIDEAVRARVGTRLTSKFERANNMGNTKPIERLAMLTNEFARLEKPVPELEGGIGDMIFHYCDTGKGTDGELLPEIIFWAVHAPYSACWETFYYNDSATARNYPEISEIEGLADFSIPTDSAPGSAERQTVERHHIKLVALRAFAVKNYKDHAELYADLCPQGRLPFPQMGKAALLLARHQKLSVIPNIPRDLLERVAGAMQAHENQLKAVALLNISDVTNELVAGVGAGSPGGSDMQSLQGSLPQLLGMMSPGTAQNASNQLVNILSSLAPGSLNAVTQLPSGNLSNGAMPGGNMQGIPNPVDLSSFANNPALQNLNLLGGLLPNLTNGNSAANQFNFLQTLFPNNPSKRSRNRNPMFSDSISSLSQGSGVSSTSEDDTSESGSNVEGDTPSRLPRTSAPAQSAHPSAASPVDATAQNVQRTQHIPSQSYGGNAPNVQHTRQEPIPAQSNPPHMSAPSLPQWSLPNLLKDPILSNIDANLSSTVPGTKRTWSEALASDMLLLPNPASLASTSAPKEEGLDDEDPEINILKKTTTTRSGRVSRRTQLSAVSDKEIEQQPPRKRRGRKPAAEKMAAQAMAAAGHMPPPGHPHMHPGEVDHKASAGGMLPQSMPNLQSHLSTSMPPVMQGSGMSNPLNSVSQPLQNPLLHQSQMLGHGALQSHLNPVRVMGQIDDIVNLPHQDLLQHPSYPQFSSVHPMHSMNQNYAAQMQNLQYGNSLASPSFLHPSAAGNDPNLHANMSHMYNSQNMHESA